MRIFLFPNIVKFYTGIYWPILVTGSFASWTFGFFDKCDNSGFEDGTDNPSKPHVSGDRKKSALYAAAMKARKATGDDPNALLLAATQCAKTFDMNRWFVLKRMQRDPDLAERLKYFICNEEG